MSQADETKKKVPYRAMDAPSISLNPSLSSNAGIVAYGELVHVLGGVLFVTPNSNGGNSISGPAMTAALRIYVHTASSLRVMARPRRPTTCVCSWSGPWPKSVPMVGAMIVPLSS